MKRSGNGASFSSERTDSSNNNNSRSSNDGLYDLLELPRNATPEEIKRTYRQLALLWHPDKGGNVKRFQSLTAAWETLGNPERRSSYDRQLKRLGSKDGISFKQRYSWDGTSKSTVKTTREVGGANVATPETNTTRVDKKSAEWLHFCRRRHSTGELFTQHQGGKKETDLFEPWEQEHHNSTSGRTAVPAAKIWKSNNNPASVLRPRGTTETPSATAQQSSTTTTQAFERVEERRSDAGSATVLPPRQGNSKQHAEKETAHCNLINGRSDHSSANGSPEWAKGCIEEILNRSKRSDPVAQENFSPFGPSIFCSSSEKTNDLFDQSSPLSSLTVTSAPGNRTFPRNFRNSSSFPLSAAGCNAPSATTAAAVNEVQSAADNFVCAFKNAAAHNFIPGVPLNWTAGNASTESLERLEAGLKEVLGEKGLFKKIPSTTSSIHEEVHRLGVKQLKELLSILSIPHDHCIEKYDLLEGLIEAFPDVILTRQGTGGEPLGSTALGTHGCSNSLNRNETGSNFSIKSVEDVVNEAWGKSDYVLGAEGINSDARSDSISSSEGGIFYKFYTPDAAAHGAIGTPKRNAASVAAVAIARRRRFRGRRLISPQISNSGGIPAAVPSSSVSPPSAVTEPTLSFASPVYSYFAASTDRSSDKKARKTISGDGPSELAHHTVAAPCSIFSGDIRIKLIAIGSEKTGKSCIIKRYCEGRFVARNASTVALDYGVKVVKVKQRQDEALNAIDEERLQTDDISRPPETETLVPVRVNFFDFSGKHEFKDVRKDFYAFTDGVMLVYDVSRRQSFLELKTWIVEAANLLQQHHHLLQQLTPKQSVWTPQTRNAFSKETNRVQAPISRTYRDKHHNKIRVQYRYIY